jgi:hypothetical protein
MSMGRTGPVLRALDETAKSALAATRWSNDENHGKELELNRGLMLDLAGNILRMGRHVIGADLVMLFECQHAPNL